MILVQGIRISPARYSGVHIGHGGNVRQPAPAPIPAHLSSFEYFFEPILSELARYYWTTLPLIEPAEEDEDFDAMMALIASEPYVPPGTLLPEFARYMIEDWCDFAGFVTQPTWPMRETVWHCNDQIHTAVDIAFRNIDSAYWEMYSTDEGHLARVTQHVRNLSGIGVKVAHPSRKVLG